MSLRVSNHAVDRYVERIDPRASFGEAKLIIEAAMGSAARLKERTHAGDAIFRAERFRMVVAIERNHREVLTVLQLDGGGEDGEADVPEIAEALHAEFAAWEESQPKGQINSKETNLLSMIEQLQSGVRRRQRTIENLIADREVWRQRVPRKKYEAQVNHAQLMERDRKSLRETLKNVVIRLLGVGAASALEVIEAEQPGLVGHIRKRLGYPVQAVAKRDEGDV